MLSFQVIITLEQASHVLQKIQSAMQLHIAEYIVEFTLSKTTPEFLFLSGKGTIVSKDDYIKLSQRAKQKLNFSLIISWIDFRHHSLCTSDNCGDITFVPPMCQQNHERMNSRGELLKCFNFSSVFNFSNMDYYYNSLSMESNIAKYFSWEEASDICQNWNGSLPSFESRRETTLFSNILKLSKIALPSETVFVGMDPPKVGFFSRYLIVLNLYLWHESAQKEDLLLDLIN